MWTILIEKTLTVIINISNRNIFNSKTNWFRRYYKNKTKKKPCFENKFLFEKGDQKGEVYVKRVWEFVIPFIEMKYIILYTIYKHTKHDPFYAVSSKILTAITFDIQFV